jgi:flagellar hook-associated protein 1 FlgK
MAGLFDTLTLGSRSLSTYRKAIDTTGHNLSNVSTPGYTRQRVEIQSVTTGTDTGSVGAGAEAATVTRIHNEFANRQVQMENSIQGSLESRQSALEQSLTALQETIDRSSGSGTSTSGISQALSDFFGGMQTLSTDPSYASTVIDQARGVASKFNSVDSRLSSVSDSINQQVAALTPQVNDLTKAIAGLNKAIISEEALSGGSANDLRDSRQLKLEELSKLVKFDAAEQSNGAVNIVVSGVSLVDGVDVTNQLETFDPGNGALQVRVAGTAGPLALTGGSIEGAISVRDNEVATVRSQINELASNFMTAVNDIHSAGFSASGSTGEVFFTGTNAGDIKVNSVLLSNPSALQTSGSATEPTGNATVLALAQLAKDPQASLGGKTFSSRQADIVAGLGQQLATANSDLEDQTAISSFIQAQRDSVSGVSVDEEMSNLVLYQKAFEASARLISMTNELLATIIQM